MKIDDGEVTALIEKLTEEGMSLEEIMQRVSEQFPGTDYEMLDVYSCCTEYLRRRLGVTRLNKPEVRLKVYRLFDRGKNLAEVCSMTGLPMHSVYKYHSEWSDLYGGKVEKKHVETKKAGGFTIPGGAVFGSGTRRDMIWKG